MIEDIQPRAPELGRLRCGEKGKKGEPVKLLTWRFTSHDPQVIDEAADLYGGTPAKWASPDGEQWQVVSDAMQITVLVPPDPLSASYERWSAAGCQRRCTGVTCTQVAEGEMVDVDCVCKQKGWTPGDEADMKLGACDLVSRLTVILPDLSGLGVWRLDTGSVFAYKEIAGQVELLRRLAETAGSTLDIPAQLGIEPRTIKRPGQQTRRFIVPVLRVRRTPRELAAMAGGMALEAGHQSVRELVSGRPSTIAHFAPHVRSVVITCSELGLTDQQRHALCYAASKGRVSSSKDLTVPEATVVLTALADGSWETLAAAGESPSTVYEAPAAPPSDGGQPAGEQPAGREANRQGVIDAQSALAEHKRPFTKADETLVGPKWCANVAGAAKLNGWDDEMVAAAVRHGTDGRTHVLRGVLKTEAEAVAAAFVALREGHLALAYGPDGEPPSLVPAAADQPEAAS